MKYIPLFIVLIFSHQLVAAKCLSIDELEIERQSLDTAIASSQSCQSDADCELLSLGCPIGCSTPVNRSSSETIIALAERYHSKTCDKCMYKCPPQTSPICVENICVQK